MCAYALRLKGPTLAVLIHHGSLTAVTVPADSIIELAHGLLDGDQLMDVRWDGKTVMMFTTDIRKRGERIDAATHSALE
jgi:hypothetical protein